MRTNKQNENSLGERALLIRQQWVGTLALALLLSLLVTGVAQAVPITTVDQSQTGFSTSGLGANSPFTFGQSFIPSLTGIEAIEFRAEGGVGVTAFVRILDGVVGSDGLGGAVLGTSAIVSLPSTSAVVHFDFPSLILLTSGNPYVAAVSSNGPFFLQGVTSDLYPNGQQLHPNLSSSLSFLSGRDLFFIEGLHEAAVPEPSTLLLLGSGLAALGGLGWRRHRRK